jgi:hypothetical protein
MNRTKWHEWVNTTTMPLKDLLATHPYAIGRSQYPVSGRLMLPGPED